MAIADSIEDRMLLRDRLLARLAGMGASPDYVALAAEVLGIRHAPPALAKRLVDQALVVEDRREAWLRTGERICADAPDAPGVYVLRDAEGRALYVGKANNIRRRLRTHFAARRWRHLKPAFARAQRGEWQVVGSEIEALLREAQLIRDLQPVANVQVGAPSLETRAVPEAVMRDTIVVLPSADADAAELLGARVDGGVLLVRVGRAGKGLAARIALLRRFFGDAARGAGAGGTAAFDGLAPLVFSWIAGRGHAASRLDPHDVTSGRDLERRVKMLLDDDQLFTERIVVIRSVVPSTRP
ncbi:MAG: nucleotide excision repair endonuclease [Vicinamibacterales bacterium]